MGSLDTELLVAIVPVFNEFSAVIDIAENHSILRSEKVIIAHKLLDCAQLLPETAEGQKFRKLFSDRVKEKIFNEVLNTADYLCVMMIPDSYYQTLSMLSTNQAKTMKKEVFVKLGQLLRHEEDEGESDEETEKSKTDLFFSDLHRKNRSNEEESYFRTYSAFKNLCQAPKFSHFQIF